MAVMIKLPRLSAFAVLTISSALFAGSAQAQQSQIKVGTLTCSGAGGVGLIITSQKTFACTFSSSSGGKRERYAAKITKYGLDVGITGPTTIVWAVLAPSVPKRRGALAGNYVGASADASIGLGGGANALVGGSQNTFTLQPLSLQGQTGINLAVGVSGLQLR